MALQCTQVDSDRSGGLKKRFRKNSSIYGRKAAMLKNAPGGFITVDDALKLNKAEIRELQMKHQNGVKLELAEMLGAAKMFVKGDIDRLWDDEGNLHYDMIAGVGAIGMGNCNQFIWEQMEKTRNMPIFYALGYHNMASALAHNLAITSPDGKLTRMWTGGGGGAEANEGAIKLCKMAAHGHRPRIASVMGSYHGKTAGSLALTGSEKWKKYQFPLMPAVNLPFGDLVALEDCLKTRDVCAFFIEPIQGEGGIKLHPEGYLKAARELCTRCGTYLVCDEIQTGLGRTGKMWACEHDGIVPDVIVFAKGISGGFMPLAGYICTEELWNAAYGEPETCFHHTVTFGESPLACAAGIASLQYIFDNDLIREAARKGDYLQSKLREIAGRYPNVVKEIRGRGLMIGIEFHLAGKTLKEMIGNRAAAQEAIGARIASILMNKHNVQVMFTINNPIVIRMLPPLAVRRETMDYAAKAFESACEEVSADF
jgi:putrescine aminotransferase